MEKQENGIMLLLLAIFGFFMADLIEKQAKQAKELERLRDQARKGDGLSTDAKRISDDWQRVGEAIGNALDNQKKDVG